MSPKRIKPSHIEVKVFLDTNALYTGSASYFVRKEVADLITQNADLPDLKIGWIVPEIVRHERQFQMLQEAGQMLPTIERLERLLGHNLNITADILEARVNEAVERQVKELQITVQTLKADAVDWPRLMMAAAYRKPPFQVGEKEKGFRDALILETFLQLVDGETANRAALRLAFVSNDALLREATQSRLASSNNVHVLESIDALKGLINTLGSTVDEEFIASIEKRTAEVFFKTGDENTLYYKASVSQALNQTLKNATLKLPDGADKYEVEKWVISRPRFVKKQGQRIHWVSRFEARLKAVKSATKWEYSSVFSGGSTPADLGKVASSSGVAMAPSSTFTIGSGFPATNLVSSTGQFNPTHVFPFSSDQFVGQGAAFLDVAWNLSVTTAGTLTKPKLESVDFVETVWS